MKENAAQLFNLVYLDTSSVMYHAETTFANLR